MIEALHVAANASRFTYVLRSQRLHDELDASASNGEIRCTLERCLCQRKKRLNGPPKMHAKGSSRAPKRENSFVRKWIIFAKENMVHGRPSRRLPSASRRPDAPA